MNITENFRRKNKFHKPIIVFKELYRDYFKHTYQQNLPLQKQSQTYRTASIENGNNLNIYQQKNNIDGTKKLLKTRSAEQLSKYLYNHGDLGTTLLNSTRRDQSGLTRSKSTKKNTYVFRLLQRNQLEEMQRQKQSYFHDLYTKSHPLFQKSPNFLKEKQLNLKNLQNPTILPQIFRQTGNRLKKPSQKRVELQQLKTKLKERKNQSTQQSLKIRHNFLIKKKFRIQNSPTQFSCNNNQMHKNSFQKTKQNIFPETSL